MAVRRSRALLLWTASGVPSSECNCGDIDEEDSALAAKAIGRNGRTAALLYGYVLRSSAEGTGGIGVKLAAG